MARVDVGSTAREGSIGAAELNDVHRRRELHGAADHDHARDGAHDLDSSRTARYGSIGQVEPVVTVTEMHEAAIGVCTAHGLRHFGDVGDAIRAVPPVFEVD